MAPLFLALAVLLCPAPARAGDARSEVHDAAVLSAAGAAAPDENAAKERASEPFDGGAESDTVVDGRGTTRPAERFSTPTAGALITKVEPPPAVEKKPGGGLSTKLQMAGGAIIGGLQGFFTAGLFGAIAGAGLGLAAAWLFHKGDYGASFGVTAGAIIGSALGGPIGAIIGAVLGGLIGHFLGKRFL